VAKKIALFPGSFDPLTKGHVDLIKRAASLFDEVIVGIFTNTQKKYFFDARLRLELVEKVLKKSKNVCVSNFSDQLTVDVACKVGAKFLLRGIRNVQDYEYERDIERINSEVSANSVETVFLMSTPKYAHVNSNMIKEIYKFGGDVSSYLPEEVFLLLDSLES